MVRIKTDEEILASRPKRRVKRAKSRNAKALDRKAISAAVKYVESSPKVWRKLINNPEPGIYEKVPFDVYEQIDALNQSKLQKIKRSPYHYRYDSSLVDSRSLRKGTLVHAAVLEPHDLQRHYIALPDLTTIPAPILRDNGQPYDNPRATKVYKQRVAEFQERHQDKQIIEVEEYNELASIAKSVQKSPQSKQLLSGAKREVTILWQDPTTGILCKARLDIVNNRSQKIGDVKTTSSLAKFAYSMGDFGYHVQAAFYQTGWQVLTGKCYEPHLLVVENSSPFDADCAPIHPDDIELGLAEMHAMLATLDQCRRSKKWPGVRRKFFRVVSNYKPYSGLTTD